MLISHVLAVAKRALKDRGHKVPVAAALLYISYLTIHDNAMLMFVKIERSDLLSQPTLGVNPSLS